MAIEVFARSGTTGVVAQSLGYDSLCYEVDEKYCEIIRNRKSLYEE